MEFVVARTAVTVEEPEGEGECHKDGSEPDGGFGEDVGSLRSKDGFGEVATKGGAQTLGAGFLHKNEQGQKNANEDIDPQ